MAQESPRARPVQLHVIHDLGGGSAKWLSDFVAADTQRVNLVLRPFAHDAAMASGAALYADAASEDPIKVWRFATPIAATVPTHVEYRAALDEIISTHGVQALLVSSLIGHSLEVLDTGLPTVVVCHDYFPWCPAINLYYDGDARSDGANVDERDRDDGGFGPFATFPPAQRQETRERFIELVRRPNVTLVAPSDSVSRNLRRQDARFEEARFVTIPHGYGDPLPHVDVGPLPPDERLRILVLGQISTAKGKELLDAALPRLTSFADVFLLGCREQGELYKFEQHVSVVSQFEHADLPDHVAMIRPHLTLMMSVVSETFGYAVSEALMMGIPVAATRVGSFPERIVHGETGFLYEPDAGSLIRVVRGIAADREGLGRVRDNLKAFRHRTAEEMVGDYHRLAPIAAPLSTVRPQPDASDPAAAAEAVTLAGMWKHIKALHLQLSIANDARQRTEMQRLADVQGRRKLEERLERFGREIAQREAQLLKRDMEAADAANQVRILTERLAELYASTSWRVSSPVRFVGRLVKNAPTVRRVLAETLRRPSSARERLTRLAAAWRAKGWDGLDQAVVGASAIQHNADGWRDYRETFDRTVRPRIVEGVAALPRRPLISIIVPVYNTDEDMLRQMLVSVRAQVYPEWELCVVDDASPAPHVRKLLEEFAAIDRRIKLHFAPENKGVSQASNRGLEMAGGEYVLLLDHDDCLEEQALFRVAQSIVEDDPDIVYSDEVLIDARDKVVRYTFRPVFSPEHLRSHPYIVHLVAFRTSLLREIGGWNPELSISQDYDLILRATEKARTIAHIPEILYRWRIHSASSGIARQGLVMDTSKAILRRHLERAGVQGTVEDGASFNFFSVRYPLREGLRVAIIIPTKNHGDLLRHCIDSIRATVKGVEYDIVVVDHESDEPGTRAYLASIQRDVQVLPYEGPFNFAAINNWAVRELDRPYSHYLLCNNDIEAYEPGWLERMLELGQHADVGIVGALLLYPERKVIQHAGVCVGIFRAAEAYGKFLRYPEDAVTGRESITMNREVSAVTAACMLVSKDAWGDAGGFDESIAVGFGDVDFCLRVLEAGRRVLYCAHARLVHHESITRGVSPTDPHPVDTSLFRIRWKELLDAGDPYYNPGLSPASTAWDVRQPLRCSAEVQRRVAVIEGDPPRWSITYAAAPKANVG